MAGFVDVYRMMMGWWSSAEEEVVVPTSAGKQFTLPKNKLHYTAEPEN